MQHRKCKCGRGYDISSLCIERSGNSRSVFEIVLQKERYGKTVCTAVASDRGGSAAYKDNELEKDFLMKWIDVIDYQ